MSDRVGELVFRSPIRDSELQLGRIGVLSLPALPFHPVLQCITCREKLTRRIKRWSHSLVL